MRIGGLVWFIAGFAFCLLYLNDGIGGFFSTLVGVVGAVVTFVVTLGGFAGDGVMGVFAVLALIGVTLFVGREWSERARGKVDADDAYRKRKAYRTPKKSSGG